jgi:hypothetical protein
MKITTSILPFLALGAAGFLSSCVVDPYYTGSSTTVTTYRPGYVVSTLPGGYRTETYGGVSYYRHNDVYYRRQGSRYVVVERPSYDRRDDRRDDRYDRRDDRRDRYDDRRDSRYDGPGRRESTTTVIRTLPSGARMVTYSGNRYYESRGTYYRPSGNGYVIVTRPF